MRRVGIQTRIFMAQALVITFIISTLSILYYQRTSSILVENSQEQTRQIVLRIHTMLEQKIKDMDEIATQIAYSRDIREQFNQLNQIDLEPHTYAHVRKNLEDRLAEINAPAFSAKQINLFNTHGTLVSYLNTSDFMELTRSNNQSYQWINRVLNRSGGKFIIRPRLDEWSSNPEFVFSVARSVMISNSGAPVIVEVQKSYAELADSMSSIFPDSLGQVYIYNQDNKLVYPLEEKPTDMDIIHSFKGDRKSDTVVSERSGDFVISQLSSEYLELTIVVRQPIHVVLQGIQELRLTTILVALSSTLLALLGSYLLGANIIYPLKQLQKLILRLDMESAPPLKRANLKPNTPIEIVRLHQAFEDMQDRLNTTLNEIVDAHNRENLAQLQALQAQMNPHFLYNTLYSLSTYAEELGHHQFAEMCYNLISMMRYISLPVDKTVDLKDEIAHTQAYLSLMKLRYEDRLWYTIEFDESLSDIQVPKFILQPFVENAFQHGFLNSTPPYTINIQVQQVDSSGGWSLLVSDNGSGFKPEQLDRILSWLSSMEEDTRQKRSDLSRQGIGGMGLLNTFMRCRHYWKEHVSYSVVTSNQGTTINMRFNEERDVHVSFDHR
ncbi:cache domain-containing sensor histidine kinase [Paenibacillus puerhi]|uniref:cache domain-containing sensor histidine kinase n=1 Tax=Paenibacillus puerhi TaxID=2692622 RepID=UPI0013574136|nr:sensor histidine kinase [Paenibacillus puerhi]